VKVAVAAQYSVLPHTFTAYFDPGINPSSTAGFIPVPGAPALGMTSASSPSFSLAALNTALSLDAPTLTLSFSGLGSASLLEAGNPLTTALSGDQAAIVNQVNQLAYAPATPVVPNCNLNGACTAGITFADELTFGTPKDSIVTIDFQALTSFNTASLSGLTNFYSIMKEGGSCASCHTTGEGAGAWTFVDNPPTPANNSLGAQATFNNIQRFFTPGDPTGSILYNAPCVTGFGDMPVIFSETSHECQVIYQWILEGARFN
jgi:hypothetical protein